MLDSELDVIIVFNTSTLAARAGRSAERSSDSVSVSASQRPMGAGNRDLIIVLMRALLLPLIASLSAKTKTSQPMMRS